MKIPRWKRWLYTLLPALLSCGLSSIVLGIIFSSWWNVGFGLFCLAGFMRGIFDPQIRWLVMSRGSR